MLAGACASTKSNKAATYDTQPKRLLVVETIKSYPNLRPIEFDSKLVAALAACGVTAEIHPVAPVTNFVAIDDADEAATFRAQAEHVARFKPDGMLRLVEAAGNYRLIGGALQTATYFLALHDVASDKTVWKAQVQLRSEGGIFNVVGNPAASLASAIADRLAEDKIVGACAKR